MRIIKEQRVSQGVVSDIVCDCCGKSCLDDHKINYEFAHLVAHWGYCSHRDTEAWDCDLCEECAVKVKGFIENLGGKVRISNYM